MENVKAIFAKSNSNALNSWLSFLEEIGYKNSDNMILNSLDFGVPQSRKRAFILSSFGKKVDVTSLITYKSNKRINIEDFIFYKPNESEYEDDVLRFEANQAQLNLTTSREEMWNINQRNVIDNNTIINTITCNMDRSNTAAMFRYRGPKGATWRLLTIREAFLLMGFTMEEYERTKQLNLSYRKMNRLIGNSIVVNVLEEVFKLIYKDFCEE
jgi:DNA (cytosine-5)-methyltransferase 1